MLVLPFEISEIKTKRNWGQFRGRNRNRNFVFLSFSKKRNRRNEIRGNFEIEISNEISFFYKFWFFEFREIAFFKNFAKTNFAKSTFVNILKFRFSKSNVFGYGAKLAKLARNFFFFLILLISSKFCKFCFYFVIS